MDVLRLMAMGFDTAEICDQTQRSVDTLYYLQGEIRRRLEARSNEQAIVKAWRKQMVAMLTYPEEKAG
jgi:DNA-binding CsgD family transcriptional regulator